MLNIIDELNDEILALPAHRLYEKLPGPTLVHIKGEREPEIFLSVLLHGNENTGWEVVKNILKKYKEKTLPRSLTIFIGNIEAARFKQRKLETQSDYNRVWGKGESNEHLIIQSVMNIMRDRDIFVSIDIHNNNGLNPHYACINKLEERYLKLAREFSRIVIYFIRPTGVQSLAFAEMCPAVTLECGQPGDEYGIQLTLQYVEKMLQLETLDTHEDIKNNIDLYHTTCIVKIPEEFNFSFNEVDTDINFINGIEKLNFEEIMSDTLLADIRRDIKKPFIVLNEEGYDVFDNYFYIQENCLYTKTALVPAMLTTDKKIVRQDCLCYLMERYDVTQGEKVLNNNTPLWS